MTVICDTIIITPVAEVFVLQKQVNDYLNFGVYHLVCTAVYMMRRNFDRLIKQRIKLHRKEFLL